ncbi:MAG: C40 family peptidase [Negativicutes bacterium]|nr:C40 family peptidase [Negativicutes bacterium]
MTETFGAVNVPVAVLWTEPGAKRAYDELILAPANAPAAWADGMDDEMRLWLVGKVETQVLFGERLAILDRQGDWLKVAAVEQLTDQDGRGYPGWLPAAQVCFDETYLREQEQLPLVAVTAARTPLYLNSGATAVLTGLTYQTRLPRLAACGETVTVRLPDGGTGFLPAAATTAVDEISFRPENLPAEARRFLGLRYIWGGTSAYGFDCSGFALRLYQSQGLRIPRDADEQARAGTAVARADLACGDLLFFAGDNGQGAIHHVGIYAGEGLMIHAPNSRSAVREEPFAAGVYGDEYCGARRYR